MVNSVRGAVASAVEGHGITRLFSYHAAEQLSQATLEILLAHAEHPAVPLHLISPRGRLAIPKVRAFVDFAVPRLKAHFSRLASDAARQQRGIQPPHGASRGVGYDVGIKGKLNGRKPERDRDDQYAVDKVL